MSKKKITLAKYAGFCYGVKRAVDSVLKLKSENPKKKICILGELIHNNQVIQELNNCGIETVYQIPQHSNGFCVVRTHGQSPEIFDKIKESGLDIYDLTCPDVKKVQQKAIELVKQGYYLIIIGKEEHPEVSAIKSNALLYGDKVVVGNTPEQLKKYESQLINDKIGVVVQTTQTISTLNDVIEYLLTISKELHVFNTICPSTSKRQTEAKELARNNDLMIIVGSKNSANTTHLSDICSKITQTILIETENELKNYQDLIDKSTTIGVSAGASTPQSVIDKVIEKLDS